MLTIIVCGDNIFNRFSVSENATEEFFMCTAITYKTEDFYFGRNLDYEAGYGESVVVVPRNFPFGDEKEHYAMIGTAHVLNGYPLFYDAVNEKGLCAAGLNFVGNAFYGKEIEGKKNIAQYEFIARLLGSCADIAEARDFLSDINITDTPFCEGLPSAQLHWMIADKNGCIVVESMRDGVHVYDDPVGVLTNNPPFPIQLFSLNDYMALSPKSPENRFSPDLGLKTYSRGMGAMGLPGDLSSRSRFIRAAFVRENSLSGKSENESVSQFFHILGSVEQQRGCCEVRDGEFEITLYSCCFNADKGIYYYKTYENGGITAVDMRREDLDGKEIISFPMKNETQIFFEN